MKNLKTKKIIIVIITLFTIGISLHTIAAAPGGNFWFQFFTQTQTGADNSGDGGTGNPTDFNYYYVGQSVTFRADVGIGSSHPSNTADFLANFDQTVLSGSGLTSLSAYQNWVGQSLDNTTGVFKLSAYNNPGVYYTGQRQYANITFTMLKPTAYNYGTTSTALNIVWNGYGITAGDSNIGQDGPDYMDSKKDFNMIVLADTKKPYAQNPNPINGAQGVTVDSTYQFDVRDSKNGEGDDSGVGTGFTAPPTGRTININNGVSTTNYTSYTNHSCSGTWQTLCHATITPNTPSGISGDQRKWNYNTTYTVTISGYQDRASNNQSQLGDASGPNVMNTKNYTFKTEADIIPPQVSNITPAQGATNVSLSTNIVVDIIDIKSANISGVGVDSTSCSINVSSPSLPLTTYTNGSSGLAISSINYGYRYTITPSASLPQNEIVSVSVFGCKDLVGNNMPTQNYTFTTLDASAPYIDSFTPVQDAVVSTTTPVKFSILDTGVGVDINNTVVYINGNYYKKGGGSGSLIDAASTIPTKISFTNSTDLTPFITSTSTSNATGYLININNLSFSANKPIPVIIYTKDLNNNVMERYVSTFLTVGNNVVSSGSVFCDSTTSIWDGSKCVVNPAIGSTFCDPETSQWNGSKCVGIAGGGGSPSPVSGWFSSSSASACILPDNNPKLGIYNAIATQINANGVLVTWNSGDIGTGEVRYGSEQNNLNNISQEISSASSAYHSVEIDNLTSGKVYFFKPISKKGTQIIDGPILKMAPLYIDKEQAALNISTPSNNNSTNILKNNTNNNSSYKVSCLATATTNNNSNNKDDNKINYSPIVIIENAANSVLKKSTYIVGGILLLAILAVLSRMLAKISRRKNILQKQNKINMPKIRFTKLGKLILIVFGALLAFIIIHNSNNISKFVKKITAPSAKNISVSGAVLDPFTLQGVGNVDLTTAKVSVRTSNDGNYSFDGINNFDGIKVTYPTLERGVNIDLSDAKSKDRINIYFDSAMYNVLNSYLNYSAQKKFVKAVDYLSNSCKERISADDLAKDPTTFSTDFTSLQFLNVSKLDSVSGYFSDACQNKFARVSVVYVKINDEYQKFLLTKEGNLWKIIK